MPCMCWYTPDDSVKKALKHHCEAIVKIIKDAENIGDPLGVSIPETKKLLDHLYTGECDERRS